VPNFKIKIHQHGKVDMLKAARSTIAEPVVRNAARSFKTEEGREEKNENPN